MVGLGPKGSVLQGDQGGKAAQTRARRPFWGGHQGRKEVLLREPAERPEALYVVFFPVDTYIFLYFLITSYIFLRFPINGHPQVNEEDVDRGHKRKKPAVKLPS